MAMVVQKRRKKRVKRFTKFDSGAVGSSLVELIGAIEKRAPGCLGYIKESTTQLYGDYNKPFQGSPLNNQDLNGT